jgi:hypothetical protein
VERNLLHPTRRQSSSTDGMPGVTQGGDSKQWRQADGQRCQKQA